MAILMGEGQGGVSPPVEVKYKQSEEFNRADKTLISDFLKPGWAFDLLSRFCNRMENPETKKN